jgi:hypothetical protein
MSCGVVISNADIPVPAQIDWISELPVNDMVCAISWVHLPAPVLLDDPP